jgi:hypothetical protein
MQEMSMVIMIIWENSNKTTNAHKNANVQQFKHPPLVEESHLTEFELDVKPKVKPKAKMRLGECYLEMITFLTSKMSIMIV